MMPSRLTRRRFLIGSGGALVGASLLAACGGSSEPTQAPGGGTTATATTPPATSAPAGTTTGTAAATATGTAAATATATATTEAKKGGKLTYGQTFPIQTTAPYPRSGNTGVMRPNLFNTLVNLDQNLQPVPELAESWELSSDRLTLTLTLRKDVKFHSGTPFTAKEAKWNIEYAQDPANKAQVAGQLKDVTSEAKDDYTLELTLPKALPQIYSLFVDLPIVDPESDIDKAIGGTGPFKVANLDPGNELHMVRNEHYWRPNLPNVDEVVVKIIPDQSTLLLNLDSGALDIISSPPLNEMQRLQDGGNTKTVAVPGDGNYNYLVNTTAPPLDDKRVRQALGLALNRKRFVDTLLFGLTDPTYIVFPKTSPVWDASLDTGEYNIEKAKQLLAEAGHPDGFEVTITATRGSIPEVFQFTQAFQADLEKIGVKATIEEVEANQWLTLITEAKFTGLLGHSYGTANMDPGMLFTTHPFNPAHNAPRFQSDDYVAKVAAAQAEPDWDKRLALYRELAELIKDEAFILPMASRVERAAMTSKVSGFALTRLGFPAFENASLG